MSTEPDLPTNPQACEEFPMQKFRCPSPALVVAFVALFVAAGGGAWAAGGAPGTRQAHRTKAGPRGPRGPGGPRGPRGFAGVVGPRGVSGPAGPSDGFVKRQTTTSDVPSGTDTTVVQLSLTPDSSYIVTAATELGNRSGSAGLISCTLLENNNPIGGGSTNLPASNTFAQTITLTAATTGGNIKLSCNPDGAAVARNSVITAIRVGTLHTS